MNFFTKWIWSPSKSNNNKVGFIVGALIVASAATVGIINIYQHFTH